MSTRRQGQRARIAQLREAAQQKPPPGSAEGRLLPRAAGAAAPCRPALCLREQGPEPGKERGFSASFTLTESLPPVSPAPQQAPSPLPTAATGPPFGRARGPLLQRPSLWRLPFELEKQAAEPGLAAAGPRLANL